MTATTGLVVSASVFVINMKYLFCLPFLFFILLVTRDGNLNSCQAFVPQPTRTRCDPPYATNEESSPSTVQSDDTTTTTVIQLPRYYHHIDGGGNDDDDKYPSALHFLHVQPVLTAAETTQLLDLARQHAAATGRWQQPDTARHASYATCDFPLDEAPSVDAYWQALGMDERIFGALSKMYGIPMNALSYLDLFVSQYRAKSNKATTGDIATTVTDDGTMDRLQAHRDGSLLSFTITLSDPEVDFQGGGTFFEALRGHESEHAHTNVVYPGGVIRPTRAGHGVFHSGKPLHGADVVTEGERVVVVGFVDVGDWWQRPGVLAEACKVWGRMDVAEKRHQRQLEKTTCTNVNGGEVVSGKTRAGWLFAKNRSKWLPRSDSADRGKSYLSGFCPAFSTVAQRADPEYQRQQRLQAEDRLLRNILLTEEEVKENLAGFAESGDITVL